MQYFVRKYSLPHSELLDALRRAAGELYSTTLVSFWRLVRKKNLWLAKFEMMRWHKSAPGLHAHSADAVVADFYAALASWKSRRNDDPLARPPNHRRGYFSVTYTNSSQIRLKEGHLVLSNGKGNKPLVIKNWSFDVPQSIKLHWTGSNYQLICTYRTPDAEPIPSGDLAGIDLGEIHLAVAHTKDICVIANGRHLRSIRRYQNKLKGKLSSRIDRMQKGSKRRAKLIRSKRKQLAKIDNQIRDIHHKQTRQMISTLRELKVQKLAIGDVTTIRTKDQGRHANQKIQQWLFGRTRFYLTYKARQAGMEVVLQNEAYSSQECPECSKRNRCRSRNYSCGCGFAGHRDGIGAFNIRRKRIVESSEGHLYVVGSMANPFGLRYDARARSSTRGTEKNLALV